MNLAIAILCGVTILAYAALMILSFVNGGLSPRSIFFALIMLFGVVWASTSYLDVSTLNGFAWMFRITTCSLAGIYFFMLLFSLTLIRNITRRQLLLLSTLGAIILITFTIAVLILPNSWIFSDYEVLDGIVNAKRNIMPTILFNAILAVFGFSALAAHIIAYRMADGRRKTIIRNTMIALIVFSVFDIVFTFALNILGTDGPRVIGPMSVLIVGPIFYGSIVGHSDDEL